MLALEASVCCTEFSLRSNNTRKVRFCALCLSSETLPAFHVEGKKTRKRSET